MEDEIEELRRSKLHFMGTLEKIDKEVLYRIYKFVLMKEKNKSSLVLLIFLWTILMTTYI